MHLGLLFVVLLVIFIISYLIHFDDYDTLFNGSFHCTAIGACCHKVYFFWTSEHRELWFLRSRNRDRYVLKTKVKHTWQKEIGLHFPACTWRAPSPPSSNPQSHSLCRGQQLTISVSICTCKYTTLHSVHY